MDKQVLYQLVAKGDGVYINISKIHSRKVFTDRDLAEDYKKEFRKLITSSQCGVDLWFLEDNSNLNIAIVELELAG